MSADRNISCTSCGALFNARAETGSLLKQELFYYMLVFQVATDVPKTIL